MAAFFADPESWVGIGILIFFGLLIWKKVPALVAATLDARAATISKELDDARKLHEEARAILDEYKRKQAQAEHEAAVIVEEAHAEAQRYGSEARIAIDAQIVRRAKVAQEKIAQAQAQAVAEVRALAADAAVSAAEKLIIERMTETRASDLVKASLRDIPGKLN